MDWLQKHFSDIDDFPRPNWSAIYEHVEKEYQSHDQHELWCDITQTWMLKLLGRLSSDYALHESDNFYLVTSENKKYVSEFQKYLERTLKKIVNNLPGIAIDEGYGKYVVLIIDDIDQYYSYLTYFNRSEGEFGLSSGVFLNDGIGHFAFAHQELSYAEVIAAHEMTHALLAHLPIPAWLNEGIAMLMENGLTGSSPLIMNAEIIGRHNKFWGNAEIQTFWNGKSFSQANEGQELSYHMAQFAVKSLTDNYALFSKFVNKAHYSDGGESAAIDIYEGSLGGLIAPILGENNWAPNPKTWDRK